MSFKSKLRGLIKSRTALYALGVSVLGYMQQSRGEFDAVIALIPDPWLPFVKALVWPAVGLGIVYLRWLTTQPLEQK